jgi:hypothetical protein
MQADKMTQMLMFVHGVGEVRVALQQGAFPGRSCAGERRRAWHQGYTFPASTNANCTASKCVFHSRRQSQEPHVILDVGLTALVTLNNSSARTCQSSENPTNE